MREDDKREGKVRAIISEAASDFLTRQSNGTSLLTVTKVELFDRGSKAMIYFTVFPDDKQDEALEFTKRKRTEFKEFLKSKTKLPHIPFVDFAIDSGEKNRQKIEEIISKNEEK